MAWATLGGRYITKSDRRSYSCLLCVSPTKTISLNRKTFLIGVPGAEDVVKLVMALVIMAVVVAELVRDDFRIDLTRLRSIMGAMTLLNDDKDDLEC